MLQTSGMPPLQTSPQQKHTWFSNNHRNASLNPGKAAHFITGGLKGTVFNILKAHANILPVDLLCHRTQLNATTHICPLPDNYPLAPLVQQVAKSFVNKHRTPLHYLFHSTQLNPTLTEHIPPSCRHPFYIPAFMSRISPSKEIALDLA